MKVYYKTALLLIALSCFLNCTVIGFSIGAVQDNVLAEKPINLTNIHNTIKIGDFVSGVMTQPENIEPFRGFVTRVDTLFLVIVNLNDTISIQIKNIIKFKKNTYSKKKYLYAGIGFLLVDLPFISLSLFFSNVFPKIFKIES